MKEEEFNRMFEEVIEAESGTIHGSEKLSDLEDWDSTSVMVFLAAADRDFNVIVNPDDIARCETVRDLMKLLDDKTD